METTRTSEGNNCIRVRSAVIQLETEEDASIRHDQPVQATDDVLKSLSPLINSMRVFGLYFSRQPSVGSSDSSELSCKSVGKCQRWHPGRIYATIMFVVLCINAFRYLFIFAGVQAFGVELLLKLCLLSTALLTVVCFIAYYVASHTGSLDRVFRQVNLLKADIFPKYSRRAKVLTAICWSWVAFSTILYIYSVTAYGEFDPAFVVIFNLLRCSKTCSGIVKVVLTVVEIHYLACYMFPQTMTCILSAV